MTVLRVLLGRRLSNRESERRKITTIEGLPAIGLDGLASSAYGPEAALTILAPIGAAGLNWITPITLALVLLLTILAISYWQTIEAYPVNGGSYTVASTNLGTNAGLLAATALMVDYVLNVAVGVSAGIGALTSAFPTLHPYTLSLCLTVLAVIAFANVRGTLEAGIAFAAPTYLFIVSFGAVIVFGLWQTVLAGGDPAPAAPGSGPAATETVTLWLLLRAFAGGCTAMTGIEAVSNGVSAFREPRVKYAHRTLAAIVFTLTLLLTGIAILARAYHLRAMDQTQAGYQSILSQLTGAVVGHGTFYLITIGSVLVVLCLSANTSFVGFPRLCRLLASDGYLPRELAAPGRRLVNSVGITALAVSAGLLLIAFDGITDRLIPLFAVGAFLAFSLSQCGMAVHWSRQLRDGDNWRNQTRLAVNTTGAVATGATLAVILSTKFIEGAWITVLVIPSVLFLLRLIKRYYDQIDRQLLRTAPLVITDVRPPIVLIPIRNWDRLAERALRYALRISSDVTAVHLTRLEGPDVKEHTVELRRRWQNEIAPAALLAGLHAPSLEQIASPYRNMTGVLLHYIEKTQARAPGRAITVILPALAESHWWDYLLHTRRIRRLESALLRRGGPDMAVVIVPWCLEEQQLVEKI